MRDILFRGKHNGEWVYGGFASAPKKTLIIEISDTMPTRMEGKHVDPKTVGQYTGLTDKNGKKIFEGDIVKCSDEQYGYSFVAIVVFGNPNGEYNWGFQLKRIRGASANTDILLWVEMEETGAYIEIIGNIHDNPELLRGAD